MSFLEEVGKQKAKFEEADEAVPLELQDRMEELDKLTQKIKVRNSQCLLEQLFINVMSNENDFLGNQKNSKES